MRLKMPGGPANRSIEVAAKKAIQDAAGDAEKARDLVYDWTGDAVWANRVYKHIVAWQCAVGIR